MFQVRPRRVTFVNTNLLNRIQVVRGDITAQNVDAIVNAANETLLGGGGVDGAIHRAAGPDLLKECRRIGGCPTGEARITRGYRLPAKWIIHTVGPIWQGGLSSEPDLLAKCYCSCFLLARQNDISTIAFPSISTGAYGYPVELASGIALAETVRELRLHTFLSEVRLVCFDESAYEEYRRKVIDFQKKLND